MSTRPRLSAATPYCVTCERFVYLDTHDCGGPTLVTLCAQIRREARNEGIHLRQSGPMWVASNVDTHESASDHSMVGAWASLEDVEPTVIYRRLREAGVAPLPVGERDLGPQDYQ